MDPLKSKWPQFSYFEELDVLSWGAEGFFFYTFTTWQSRLRVSSTHSKWLVCYLAVEAKASLYQLQVTGSLPDSRVWGWPLRAAGGWFTTLQSRLRETSTHTMWLVCHMAVEAESGLYQHHVTGLLPGSWGWGWPLPATCGWFTTWQLRLRVASTRTRWLGHSLPSSRGWGWPLRAPGDWFTTGQTRLSVGL